MNKLLTFLSFLAFTMPVFAQGDLEVFTENGEPFFLVINGQQYNKEAQTNVKAYNLTQEFIKVRAVFENAALGNADETLRAEPGSITTYMVNTNKKGNYVFRYRGTAPRTQQPVAETPPVRDMPVQNDQPVNTNTQANPDGFNSNMSVADPNGGRVDTRTSASPDGFNMNMSVPDGNGGTMKMDVGVNGNPNGAGMNMNVSGTPVQTHNEVHYNTSTTTTTTTTRPVEPVRQPPVRQPSREPVRQANTQAECYPMGESDFANAKNSISAKGFEDTKMTLAKQVINANCMSTSQIKEVIKLFGFESTKLDFAKYAYKRCTDKQNYYMINDAFDFESSSEELARYITK